MRHLHLPQVNGSVRAYVGLVLAACLAVAGASCARRGSGGQAKNPLVFALYRAPEGLTPNLTQDEQSLYLSELLFDGLFNAKSISSAGRAEYESGLCRQYLEQDPEHRNEVTLLLNKAATWHDGRPFSAEDVIYTWKALHESHAPMVGWLDYLIDAERVIQIDKDKIHITLRTERSPEAMAEVFSTFKVLPRSYKGQDMPADLTSGSVANDFRYQPVGTGPYRIEKREGVTILFGRHEEHLPVPSLAGMQMVRLDPPQAVEQLASGRLHLLLDVPYELERALENAPVRKESYVPFSFWAVAYNTRRSPFNTVAFRHAINRATDKTALFGAFTGLREAGNSINTSVYPNNFEFLSRNRAAYAEADPYSPEEARRGMAAVGRPGFELLVSTELQGQGAQRFARAYVEMMKGAGIAVRTSDANALSYDSSRKEHRFDAILVHFTGLSHLYDLQDLFGERNLFGLEDEQLRQLVGQYARTFVWERLESLSQRIHARTEELAPACFVFTTPRHAYVSARVSNYTIHPEVAFATAKAWKLAE
jgi:ABC-type transport system substrate-binding protein